MRLEEGERMRRGKERLAVWDRAPKSETELSFSTCACPAMDLTLAHNFTPG